ncbi:C3a anaphylatoxin chemotactic receptor-like [Engraulis encrasicolus]|uniref:C3a anaphylatoxin chemotactic receptor-like n=1 Tax=Engraulis encrasicolus TaxID=184585 RepID=UPI002FCFF5DD
MVPVTLGDWELPRMDNSSGITNGSQTEPPLSSTQMFSLVLYCLIFVVGVIGNSFVIYVTGFRMQTTVNSIWFLNLAIADFIFAMFLIFSIINIPLKDAWVFGDFFCKFNNLVQVSMMFASIFLLTAISLDRCLSIWLVVWAHNKRTTTKAILTCVFVWLLSLGCAIPFVLERQVQIRGDKQYCVKTSDLLTNRRHAWSRFVIGFLIPFIVISCCYVAIGVRAYRSHRKKKMRPFLVILAVILTFFICWLPIQICDIITRDQLYIYYHVSKDLYNSNVYSMASSATPVAVSLAFLNSSLNPFLYTFMCEEVKVKLRRSIFLVLEHAFAEEHLFSSQFSISSRQSVSSTTMQRKATLTSLLGFDKKTPVDT